MDLLGESTSRRTQDTCQADTYAWRFSTMDPLNPFGGQDLFVRFDDTGAVLQSTVLGEYRRGLPIQRFSWEAA